MGMRHNGRLCNASQRGIGQPSGRFMIVPRSLLTTEALMGYHLIAGRTQSWTAKEAGMIARILYGVWQVDVERPGRAGALRR